MTFSYLSVKMCVWGVQKNRLIEMVVLFTHNICLAEKYEQNNSNALACVTRRLIG